MALQTYTVLGRYPDNEQTYANTADAASPAEAAKRVREMCAEDNGSDPPELDILFVIEGDVLPAIKLEPFSNGLARCCHPETQTCRPCAACGNCNDLNAAGCCRDCAPARG